MYGKPMSWTTRSQSSIVSGVFDWKMLELVDEDKIAMLREQFSEHDKDGSGRLDRDDLAIIAREKELEKARKKLALQGVHGDHLRDELARVEAEINRRADEGGGAAHGERRREGAVEGESVLGEHHGSVRRGRASEDAGQGGELSGRVLEETHSSPRELVFTAKTRRTVRDKTRN